MDAPRPLAEGRPFRIRPSAWRAGAPARRFALMSDAGSSRAVIDLARTGDTLVVRVAGAWRRVAADGATVERRLDATEGERAPARVAFDASALESWDSTLLVFLVELRERCEARGVEVDLEGLPRGVRRLLDLASAVPETRDARPSAGTEPVIDRIGQITIEVSRSARDSVEFLGSATLALGRFLRGRARFRGVDLALLVQQAGAEALPIVTLVAFLLGLILAFVAAVQLEQFGATIYVANLVGIAMLRDMGALITAIVMAGRSGAAYAAQLGSMKVSQEIDAFTTMGISPMEYLVVPRIVALVAMMPLLTVYADLVGIVGGMFVGATMLDLSVAAYVGQTVDAVTVGDLVGGIGKAAVYGGLVALAGCLRGLQAERSSAGVGDAATSAVVTSIVAIIAASGLFQFVFYVLEI